MSVEEELQALNTTINSLQQGGDLRVGFYNSAGLEEFERAIKRALKEIIEATKYTKTFVDLGTKKIEKGFTVELSKSSLESIKRTQKEAFDKATEENQKTRTNYGITAEKIIKKTSDIRSLFGDKLARQMYLSSKAFDIGLKLITSIYNSTKKYGDIAKDLSEAGLMIGSSSTMLTKSAYGTYKNIESKATDFTNIITYSANKAGLKINDFADQLKNNSDLLVRLYSMNIEGTQEIGNLYNTIEKRAKDMSYANANAIIKHWGSTVLPLYSTEEIMANKLNTSFDNLSETMNYFMKATGKSAENLIKENEIKEKTTALEQLTAENPGIVSAMKSVGYSDDMIMNALTGRITNELNLQLMNSPKFAAGLRNVQQFIAQHRDDGYLNTDEGRQLFANTLLASVNNAESEKIYNRKLNSMYTFGTYMPYEEIRKRQGVDRIIPNGINPNANILGQMSSQTEYVGNVNELSKDMNRLANSFDEIKSWTLSKSGWVVKGMDGIVSALEYIIPNGATSPTLHKLGSYGYNALAYLATGYFGLQMGKYALKGLGLLGSSSTATGVGATAGGATAGGSTLGSALLRGATAKTALATTGRLLGAGLSAGIAGYNLYDEWEISSKTKKAAQWASLGLGILGLIAAPFSGGLSLALTAGSMGTGILSNFLPNKSSSELEQSYYRGSSEGQPMYFNSPEIVNKLNQIQTVCQSIYGVSCLNSQRQVFVRMDNLSAENK